MKTVETTPTTLRRVASKGSFYPRVLTIGLAMAALCTVTAQAQVTTLDPSWRVTPDTAKPGFTWNYFQNTEEEGNSTARTEAALNGLLKDAAGNPLPNLGDPNVVGAAISAAAPANPTNGLLYFEIATVINLNKNEGAANGNFPDDLLEPGLNVADTDSNGQAAEILTYITLPVGSVVMGVNSDDGFQTSSGKNPADAFNRVVLGEYSGGRGASDTLFTNIVTAAGTYPFRTIWENGGGDSNVEWFTVDYSTDPNGVKKLINDVANGGVAAYRAAAGATLPFVRTVTPSPVPRQTELVSKSVGVVLANGTTGVDTNSIKLQIDGNLAPITIQSIPSGVSVNSAALAGLRVAGESHTAVLTFKDIPGTFSSTNQWAFGNIENLILPASPITGENFDSYPEASSAATTVPPGWVASNYTYAETPGWDLADITSDAFLNWVMITTNTVGPLEDEVLMNDQSQTVNGIPMTNAASWMDGNLIFVASDGRKRNIPNDNPEPPPASQTISVGQIQIVVSAPFNLSTAVNPVLTFSSGARLSGNGEQMSLEYSVNGGTSWLPAMYLRNAESMRLLPDGSYDAVTMFTTMDTNRLARFPTPGVGPLGGNFGDIIAAPISQALSPYIVMRNDGVAARKVEAIRLPQASKQSAVRLRLTHYGSCGWEWGIDNIAFYDVAPSSPAPVITSTTTAAGSVTVTWANGGVLESSPSIVNPVWTSTGNMLGTYTETATAGAKFYRVRR